MEVSKVNINVIKEKMNIILLLLINFSVSLNSFNCTKQITQGKNDPLPSARPEKLVIEYHLSGGMRYYYEALYISEDSSYYTVNDGGSITRINFKINGEEFSNLYKVFKENNFDRIKTYEEEVYDRGGNTIFLRWGNGKFASVSNSGMTFIKESWLEEWGNCMNALGKIMTQQSDMQKKDYLLRFDKTFFGQEINVYVNSEQVIKKSTLTAEQEYEDNITKTAKLLPGKHRVYIKWNEHYDNFEVDTDSSKGVFMKIANDSLRHEFMK